MDDLRAFVCGIWDKRLGALGALGSTVTFVTTVTIIPFMPNGWDQAAGFPAMAGDVPFLMKDVVFVAVSLYLLKQDLVRMPAFNRNAETASKRTDGMAALGQTSAASATRR